MEKDLWKNEGKKKCVKKHDHDQYLKDQKKKLEEWNWKWVEWIKFFVEKSVPQRAHL